jgi:assimilatory nitrate reductase catalytic subunit
VISDTDRISGQPEAKATPVAIVPITFPFRGFALARTPIAMPPETWWAKVAVNGGHGYQFASGRSLESLGECARAMFAADVEIADYIDELRGVYRVAAFCDGRLDGCVFIGPAGSAPHWNAIVGLFAADALGDLERRILLSGRSTEGFSDTGPLVCACFGVGLTAIRNAITSGQAADVEAIGRALRAGTNCGSCLPELKRIVADASLAANA